MEETIDGKRVLTGIKRIEIPPSDGSQRILDVEKNRYSMTLLVLEFEDDEMVGHESDLETVSQVQKATLGHHGREKWGEVLDSHGSTDSIRFEAGRSRDRRTGRPGGSGRQGWDGMHPGLHQDFHVTKLTLEISDLDLLVSDNSRRHQE